MLLADRITRRDRKGGYQVRPRGVVLFVSMFLVYTASMVMAAVFCTQCGTKYANGERFCARDGTKLGVHAAKRSQPPGESASPGDPRAEEIAACGHIVPLAHDTHVLAARGCCVHAPAPAAHCHHPPVAPCAAATTAPRSPSSPSRTHSDHKVSTTADHEVSTPTTAIVEEHHAPVDVVRASVEPCDDDLPVGFGIGYQGTLFALPTMGLLADGITLQSLSIRGWGHGRFGGELNLGFSEVSAKPDNRPFLSYTTGGVTGKGLYTVATGPRSRTYVGLQLGGPVFEGPVDIFSIGGLVGTEFSLGRSEPVSVNLDVGLQHMAVDVDRTEAELNGVFVSGGLHRYF